MKEDEDSKFDRLDTYLHGFMKEVLSFLLFYYLDYHDATPTDKSFIFYPFFTPVNAKWLTRLL